ncbi:MAG: hypothetical protein J6Q81_03595 [Lentisphaeria bacterium]|nr:hypothetical protein [Lentisphaeria bacterium]
MKQSRPPKQVYLGKYIFSAIVLLAILAGFLYFGIGLSKRDEVLIKERLTTLAGDMSKSDKESTATALLKVKGIAGAFADPMTLAMDHYAAGKFDKERLFSSVTRYRTMIGKARVSASDIIVKITDKEHAEVNFSGKFSGELKNGMSDTIIKDIEAELVKIDGKWLIKSMKFRNVLH